MLEKTLASWRMYKNAMSKTAKIRDTILDVPEAVQNFQRKIMKLTKLLESLETAEQSGMIYQTLERVRREFQKAITTEDDPLGLELNFSREVMDVDEAELQLHHMIADLNQQLIAREAGVSQHKNILTDEEHLADAARGLYLTDVQLFRESLVTLQRRIPGTDVFLDPRILRKLQDPDTLTEDDFWHLEVGILSIIDLTHIRASSGRPYDRPVAQMPPENEEA
jgi:hypothetical protein